LTSILKPRENSKPRSSRPLQETGDEPCWDEYGIWDVMNNKLGTYLRSRREALGMTQRVLAQKLEVEASHVAFMESGRRKPSLKLVARIADTLGLDRQEVLVLAHPEAKGLLTPANLEPPRKATPSWQQFVKDSSLLARYHVTKRELQALEQLSSLGTELSTKEFLAILTLIRDIPNGK
jgi:transcriptional regulator with XRE-family HTH domain